jgi:dihydropyrimidinase
MAALAGGVTCVGNMTVPGREEGLAEAVARDEELIGRLAIADILLHPVVLDPAHLDEAGIQALADTGHTSVKIFMVIRQFDENVREYVRVMRQAGEHGIMSVMHCEDTAIIAEATRELVGAGRSGLEYYAGSRPVLAEVVATRRAIAYGEITGAPIYIVHLSAAEPLSVCREARGSGLAVYVETRPIYLHFTHKRYQEPDGPLYIGQPPLREAEDIQVLWRGLEDGTIQTLGTDHVGWSRAQKLNPSLDVEQLRPGVPNLQEMLPVLYSEGVAKGRITVERFVQITSTNPAKLFGLYPRKGTIAVGSDADLVLWAPEEKRTIRSDMLLSRAGFSLFEGWEVTGWPQLTIRRGEVVYEGGRITAPPGSGQVLRRGPIERI